MKHPTAPLSISLTFGLAVGVLGALALALPSGSALSREPDKTLKLFFGHTGEKGEFTFKRNGRYDASEMKRINHFLRDWRRKEDARMDPHLLDLVWAIYQKSGSRDYIHIVSAYRSPATNEMLRKRSSGVAKNSQHRLGKAMDWYVTDVPLAKLRGIAMQMQGGGVGYYPRSGSPFVHTDTGSVRAWPRMSRQQLLALFPNGNTLHLPADGKPLPGYEKAVAQRKASGNTALAYLDTGDVEDEAGGSGSDGGTSTGWLKRIFPKGKSGKPEQGESAVATAAEPEAAPEAVAEEIETASIDVDAVRVPRARPAALADLPPVQVASIEPAAIIDIDAPSLPQARPAAPSAGSAEAAAADAIAALTARMETTPPAQGPEVDSKIALAFAALEAEPPPPSEADRNILAAFAALDASDVVRPADAVLAAAAGRRAGGTENTPPAVPAAPKPVVLASASDAVPSGGIVLSPKEPVRYGEDEPALVGLIAEPRGTPATVPAKLAMPTPAPELMVAPAAASEVADLRGRSGPPVNHFAGGTQPPAGEQGFFSRLFASLIE